FPPPQVQIQNKKIDLSHVTSKCGSLDNIHHRPGGGNVRIETVRLDFKDKAQAKVGSLDNALHTSWRGRTPQRSPRVARVGEGGSPGRRPPEQSQLSSSCSLNAALESPEPASLAEGVAAALANQG
ncbi:hypothetical protein CRUP_014504, partial [Coryphaenoides rupestris]